MSPSTVALCTWHCDKLDLTTCTYPTYSKFLHFCWFCFLLCESWGSKCAPDVTYSPGQRRSVALAPPQRAWGVWDTWFVPWSPRRSAPSSPPSSEVPLRFQQRSPWCVDPKNEPKTVRKVDFFTAVFSKSELMKKLQSASWVWIHADALLTVRKHWEETQLCLWARCWCIMKPDTEGRGYPRGDRRSDSLTSERLNGRRVRVRSSRKAKWQRWRWIRGWGIWGRKTLQESPPQAASPSGDGTRR